MEQAIAGVSFDCFGVLMGDPDGDYWNTIYRAAGGDPIKDEAFLDELFDKVNHGSITDAQFERAVERHLRIPSGAFTDQRRRGEKPNKTLLTYIGDVVRPAVDGRLVVTSNAGVGVVADRLGGYTALFSDIVESAAVGTAKPSAHIYQVAAGTLALRPNQMIHVDDTQRYIQAAVEAGMAGGVHYTDIRSCQQGLARFLPALAS